MTGVIARILEMAYKRSESFKLHKQSIEAKNNELSDLSRRISKLEAEAAMPSKTRPALSPREVYSQYFELSSDMSLSMPIEVQSSAARSVWEEGGEGGIEHKKSHSHWADSNRFADSYQKWGERCRSVIERHPRFDRNRSDYAIAEYGPGGGAVLTAVSSIASILHGFDIAQSNLDECSRILGGKFVPHLVSDDMSDLGGLDIRADIFVSFNVFQHFPSKAYAKLVLDFIAGSTKNGGISVIDIRFDNGNPKYVGYSVDEYRTINGHTYPNCIRIDLFTKMLEDVGFTVNHIGMIAHFNNMATFWVTKK